MQIIRDDLKINANRIYRLYFHYSVFILHDSYKGQGYPEGSYLIGSPQSYIVIQFTNHFSGGQRYFFSLINKKISEVVVFICFRIIPPERHII